MIVMIGPILRALSRRGAAAGLVVLEVAFGLSVAVGAMVFGRFFDDVMRQDSRIDPGCFVLSADLAMADARPEVIAGQRARDLAALRAVPGIAAATPVLHVPRNRGGFANAIALDDKVVLAYLFEGVDLRQTLNVPLAAGRDLTDADATAPGPTAVLVSPALAAALGGDVLGRTLTVRHGQRPLRVVGVTTEFHPVSALAADAAHVIIAADAPPLSREQRYLVRAAPGTLAAAQQRAVASLMTLEPRRVMSTVTLDELRRDVERSATGAVAIFGMMVVAVVFMVLLGSLGMASFLVAERRKQIGTRRALGATRADIVKYFLIENWLTTTAGLILGLPLTAGLSAVARSLQPELVLDWQLLAVGGVLFWVTGLAAALVPALRAATEPPTTATRTI